METIRETYEGREREDVRVVKGGRVCDIKKGYLEKEREGARIDKS